MNASTMQELNKHETELAAGYATMIRMSAKGHTVAGFRLTKAAADVGVAAVDIAKHIEAVQPYEVACAALRQCESQGALEADVEQAASAAATYNAVKDEDIINAYRARGVELTAAAEAAALKVDERKQREAAVKKARKSIEKIPVLAHLMDPDAPDVLPGFQPTAFHHQSSPQPVQQVVSQRQRWMDEN